MIQNIAQIFFFFENQKKFLKGKFFSPFFSTKRKESRERFSDCSFFLTL